jgi:hypothetical protein
MIKRSAIISFAVIALLLAAGRGCPLFTQVRPQTGQPSVTLISVSLDSRNPKRTQFGRLTLLNAYELRSKDRRFGGLSGLTFGADGLLYAISDRGYWLSARPRFDAGGRLLDLGEWQIAPLLTPAKIPVQRFRKFLSDAEALAQAPDGSFIVAFEQDHRLWRYGASREAFSVPPVSIPIPIEMSEAPSNGGLEAVSVLPDGRILVIAEELTNSDGSLKGWIINNRRFTKISYLPADGFTASDCAALKNGDVIVLERRWSLLTGFGARLTLLKHKDIRPGAILKGEELIRLDPPLNIDNFEGLAAQETAGGLRLLIVSDDNYSRFQRTLLLQFVLPAAAG